VHVGVAAGARARLELSIVRVTLVAAAAIGVAALRGARGGLELARVARGASFRLLGLRERAYAIISCSLARSWISVRRRSSISMNS